MAQFTMMVCPHDTVHEPERWHRLKQYLAKVIGETVHLSLSLDFPDFQEHLHEAAIVYANPGDTLKLVDGQGYIAVAHPTNLFDEAVFVASESSDTSSLAVLNGATITTVTNLIASKVAVRSLRKQGITPGGFEHTDSWLSVVGCLWRGECQYGIVYRDTYEGLSEQGKGMVKLIGNTDEHVAFHSLLISPALADKQAALTEALLAMSNEPAGKAILDELKIAAWAPVTSEQLATMGAVMAE
ncbi:MAG: phosphate/phosphite/phosphonate ABC transporter substrate-binding protein [Chloroflexaceae bacterium]|nr:phosphate/phosphite/phosphonate ABC transporter substrate-binding protein [Chloroflexaceae bacterium]